MIDCCWYNSFFLSFSSGDSDLKTSRLTIVIFSHSWLPFSVHTAREVEKLRKSGTVKVPTYIVDADVEGGKLLELG